MTEDRSAVTVEAVFGSWTAAESARRSLELLNPGQCRLESLSEGTALSQSMAADRNGNAPTVWFGGFSGELNVLSLISDELEMLSGGEVFDAPAVPAISGQRQGVLLSVSVSEPSLAQAEEMIIRNGGTIR